MTPALVTLMTGLLLLFTSFCVGLYEILLSPEALNYPNGRRRVRTAWFCVSAAFLYRAAEILCGLAAPEPTYVTFGSSVGTLAVATAFALQLEQHLRQWLPAKLQRRVQQLIDVASCRRRREVAEARKRALAAVVRGPVPPIPSENVVSPALADLAMSGWSVAGPQEPASVVEPPPHWNTGV